MIKMGNDLPVYILVNELWGQSEDQTLEPFSLCFMHPDVVYHCIDVKLRPPLFCNAASLGLFTMPCVHS